MKKILRISIIAKIIFVIFLVIVTNIIIGYNGMNNLKNLQLNMEEILEVRAANLNLLRAADIDLHQMYLAEKDLWIYMPGTEEFNLQLEEYNKQKEDVQEKFLNYKENMLSLSNEENLIQAFEQKRDEYYKLSNEIVQGLSSNDSGVRQKAILLAKNKGYESFDAAEDALDEIGDYYYDDNNIMLERVKENYEELVRLTVIIIVSCLGVSLILGFFVIRALNRPITYLKNNVKKITEGNLTVQIPVVNNDELGDLSKDFNIMVGQTKELITTVRNTVDDMNSSSVELATISEQTTSLSEEIRKEISGISDGASKQVLLVENSNQKIMHLSHLIESLNEKNEEMNLLSSKAENVLSGGIEKIKVLQDHTSKSEKVNQLIVEKVKMLVENMKNITYIVETLNDISRQTNLLALNAGVEAARAGKYGKGFAVVAMEIRKLATQSSDASNKIKDTIVQLEEEVDQTFQLMNETDKVAKEQSSIVGETQSSFTIISETITHILDSVQEINNDIIQANELKGDVVEAVQDISSVANNAAAATQLINTSVDDQSAALSNLQKSAKLLKRLSEEVNTMIRHFNVG